MIYDRPNGIHHPAARVLAGFVVLAMLVLAFMAFPPQTFSATVTWQNPVGLKALPASTATGRRVPVMPTVQIDGTYPVAATTTPTLVWRNVPAGTGQVEFRIVSLAETNPQVIWSGRVAVGSDRVASMRVPEGKLTQGTTYGWAAASTSNATVKHGPFQVAIDVQRSGAQPTWAFSGVNVADESGELIYTWQGASLPTLSGGVGWSLMHRATNVKEAGLPTGWNLVVSGGTSWRTLTANADGSMTLVNATGGAVTYAKQGQGQWRPLVGKLQSAGATTQLTANADGTFSATDGNRSVTVFSKPEGATPAHPTRVWALDSPAMQQTWTDQRLSRITDPVTGNEIGFFYGGDAKCATATDPGFIAVPTGDLCAVVDWGGNVVEVEYVQTPAGPQISRLATGLGLGPLAQAQDIGWDASGRIASLRTPITNTTIASGVVTGLGEADPRGMTQIAYDAQGRVSTITAPASLIAGASQPQWREQRAQETFTYAPFTVRATGVNAPAGALAQVWIDPLTLQPTKTRDESGNVIEYTYDARGDLIETRNVADGTVSKTVFDAQGRPIERIGPTRGPLTSPTAPKTTTSYDQDRNGKAWIGLATRYWDNAGFNGAPAEGTTGPVLPGGTAPVAGLSLNWATNPVGTGAWSARLTGGYVAPADGSYVFDNTTAAPLWVNGAACVPSCSVKLTKGSMAQLQIDVVSAAGEAVGINALVTKPDGTRSPIPTADLRPEYGLATSTTTREHLAGGGTGELTTKNVYDPTTTQLIETISPSGATQTRTYEPFAPSKGQWGRSTSVTDSSGRVATSSFYGADATATNCAGVEVAQQSGAQATTAPGMPPVVQVSVPGGGAVKTTDGTTTACTSSTDIATTSTTTGIGDAVTVTNTPIVQGNPLDAVVSTTVGTTTTTEHTKFDSNGNPWETIDAHGTKTVQRWNPYTGNVDQVVETTKGGEARTVDYAYAAGGDVATITVNGRLLLTNTYSANGTLMNTKLADGATQTFELDTNNAGKKTTTTFADGTTLTEVQTHSPTGRLLDRTLTGPGGTAKYVYTYNRDGRLIDTTLTGTHAAKETAWKYGYDGANGRVGDRSSTTVTTAAGAITDTFTYGPDNRPLTASSGRAKGTVQYDAAGRATKVGATTLTYDAAGGLLSATDGKRTYAFGENGTRTTLTEQRDGVQHTVTAIQSGQSLVLGADGKIDAQVMTLAEGITVILDQAGAPARWVFDDALGNATWTAKLNASPTKTHLYSPQGNAISVDRVSAPVTPTDLILDSLGWGNGSDVSTLRLATPISIMGARSYSPDLGTFLQPDPSQNATFNAYEYALGDPINMVDPTGNSSYGWLWGAIAATVAGIAIGVFTFGIGTAAAATYGLAAIATQMAIGAVVGAASGAIGEVVTQLANGSAWAEIDWSAVGVAVGYGAATGAVFAGLSSVGAKFFGAGRNARMLAANSPREAQTMSRGAAFSQVRTQYYAKVTEDGGSKLKAFGKSIFKGRAKPAKPTGGGLTVDDLIAGRFSAETTVSGSLRPSGAASKSILNPRASSVPKVSNALRDAPVTRAQVSGSAERMQSAAHQTRQLTVSSVGSDNSTSSYLKALMANDFNGGASALNQQSAMNAYVMKHILKS